ncbi:MAG: flippase-like domain-containing protein [Elusimicrobia bacterium]|nr:flippase-like domain-containing protein [Elusimicrobiota bacterium]
MRKIFRAIISVALGVLFLWLALRRMPWSDLRGQIAELAWWRPVLMAAMMMAGMLFRGFRMSWIISGQWRYWAPCARAMTIGLGANAVIPLRVGEGIKVFYLVKNLKSGILASGLAVAVERMLDVLCLLILLAFAFLTNTGLFYLWFEGVAGTVQDRGRAVLMLALILGFFVIVAVIALIFDIGAWRTKLMSKRDDIVQGWRRLAERLRGRVAVALGTALTIWLFDVLQLGLISRGFGITLTFPQMVFTQAVLAMAYASSVSPGAIGIYELMGSWTLGQMGFAKEQSLAMLLVLHATIYLSLTASVVGALIWEAMAAPLAAQEVELKGAGDEKIIA